MAVAVIRPGGPSFPPLSIFLCVADFAVVSLVREVAEEEEALSPADSVFLSHLLPAVPILLLGFGCLEGKEIVSVIMIVIVIVEGKEIVIVIVEGKEIVSGCYWLGGCESLCPARLVSGMQCLACLEMVRKTVAEDSRRPHNLILMDPRHCVAPVVLWFIVTSLLTFLISPITVSSLIISHKHAVTLTHISSSSLTSGVFSNPVPRYERLWPLQCCSAFGRQCPSDRGLACQVDA